MSVPRSGVAWARFGGLEESNHTASISQTVVIPSGTASLTYWYRNSEVASPYTATLRVRVDGTTVQTNTETSTAQGSYSQKTVNLSAYANGASHTISFEYANVAFGRNRMLVDDVSLNHSQPVTATPTVTATVPVSPANSTTPQVKGTAETGSTVTLYSNSTCTSAALGTGTAADFAGAGITATVPANATTTIRAKATKSGQTASACSSTSVSYTNDSTAPGLVTLSSVTPRLAEPQHHPGREGHRGGGINGEAVHHRRLHGNARGDGHSVGLRVDRLVRDGGRGKHDDIQGDGDGCAAEHLGLLDQLADLRQRLDRAVVGGAEQRHACVAGFEHDAVGEGDRGGGVDGEAVSHRGLHRYAGGDGYGGGVRLTGADGDGGGGQHDDVQGDRDGWRGERLGVLDQLADLRPRLDRADAGGADQRDPVLA